MCVGETSTRVAVVSVKRRRLLGPDEDGSRLYECQRYVWRNRRQEAWHEKDRQFTTKRMALLYVAKMNSDAVEAYARSTGRAWSSLFRETGPYALQPRMLFDLESITALSDTELESYAEQLAGALSVHKAPEGTVYSYKTLQLATTSAEDLLLILQEKSAC